MLIQKKNSEWFYITFYFKINCYINNVCFVNKNRRRIKVFKSNLGM